MSAKTNSIQNFVQNSNLHPHFVQLLKGVSFANGQICTDFQVCNKKCSISLHYRTVHLFHWKIRVVLMSTLIMYCATRTFHDKEISCPKCHFSSIQNHRFHQKKFHPKLWISFFCPKCWILRFRSFFIQNEFVVSLPLDSAGFSRWHCAQYKFTYLLTYLLTKLLVWT